MFELPEVLTVVGTLVVCRALLVRTIRTTGFHRSIRIRYPRGFILIGPFAALIALGLAVATVGTPNVRAQGPNSPQNNPPASYKVYLPAIERSGPSGGAGSSPTFTLGMHLDGSDAARLWDTYALPTDSVYAGPAKALLLRQSTAGKKTMYLNSAYTVEQLIALAWTNQIKQVELNYEQTEDCAALATIEQTTYQTVKQAQLTFVFSPTGRMLQKCYAQFPQLLQNTDILIFQTEFLQGGPDFTRTVKGMIHNLRQIRTMPIWVQVSVNPPSNRFLDAQTVIATIQALEDGQGDNPDEVHVWYQPSRLSVLRQVLQAFRKPSQ